MKRAKRDKRAKNKLTSIQKKQNEKQKTKSLNREAGKSDSPFVPFGPFL